jgi:asparagine synthase (glutamine-hydrolysing)
LAPPGEAVTLPAFAAAGAGERHQAVNADHRAVRAEPRVATDAIAAFLLLRTFEATPPPTCDACDDVEFPPVLEPLAAHLATALEQAVARAVSGAEHIAVLTGGGVDSGALLAMAARARGAPAKHVEAIALHFEGPGDDRPHLARLCGDLGLSAARVTPADAVPFFAQALSLGGRPDPWPTTAFELALAMRARDLGATRILAGFGGDHVFNGEGRDLALLVKQGHPVRAVREALTLQLPEGGSGLAKLRDFLVAPLLADHVPESLRRMRRIRRQKQPWMGPAMLQFVERHFSATPGRSTEPRTPRARYQEWMASPWFRELELRRQALERAIGVRRRNPYLDPELLRVLARVPPHCLLADGLQKGLFRRAVARWVPESLRLRRDKAWLEPAIDTLVRHPGVAPQLEALLDARELAARGLVEPSAFRNIVRHETSRSASAWVHFWPALSAEAWLRGA